MVRSINAVFVTGRPGCGKATLVELLLSALSHGHHTNGVIGSVDMGGIINWVKDSKSTLGKQIREESSVGLPISDPQVVESFYMWRNFESRRNANLQTLLVSDAPRNARQLAMLKPFNRALLIHIRTEEAMPEIDKIITKGCAGRLDRSSPFKGDISTLVLERSLPLQEMVEKALLHILTREADLIPAHIIHKAVMNFRQNDHPVRRKIDHIVRTSSLSVSQPVATPDARLVATA
jgi:adenylate kinase family enzyme